MLTSPATSSATIMVARTRDLWMKGLAARKQGHAVTDSGSPPGIEPGHDGKSRPQSKRTDLSVCLERAKARKDPLRPADPSTAGRLFSLYTSPAKLTLQASSRSDHIYQCRVCKGYCLCNNHNSIPQKCQISLDCTIMVS